MKKKFKENVVIYIFFVIINLFYVGVAYSKVVVDVNKGDQDMIIYGDKIYDGLGYPVFAEDINGDGLKDIIVSATASDGPILL